jgi:hypothetical protein
VHDASREDRRLLRGLRPGGADDSIRRAMKLRVDREQTLVFVDDAGVDHSTGILMYYTPAGFNYVGNRLWFNDAAVHRVAGRLVIRVTSYLDHEGGTEVQNVEDFISDDGGARWQRSPTLVVPDGDQPIATARGD